MLYDPDVRVEGVQPPIWYALGIVEVVYRINGLRCTVTSLTDGKHGENSLHAKGLAGDVRTRGLNDILLRTIHGSINSILNPLGYDIVLEKDHIHIEYQP